MALRGREELRQNPHWNGRTLAINCWSSDLGTLALSGWITSTTWSEGEQERLQDAAFEDKLLSLQERVADEFSRAQTNSHTKRVKVCLASIHPTRGGGAVGCMQWMLPVEFETNFFRDYGSIYTSSRANFFFDFLRLASWSRWRTGRFLIRKNFTARAEAYPRSIFHSASNLRNCTPRPVGTTY